MAARVKDTYTKDSTASNKNALADPYVKAIRWASDRIGEEGVVAFVTNNSFLDAVAFDGMRKISRRRFRCDLHSRFGWECPQEPKALRDKMHNVFRNSGRCEHQFL